MDKDIADFYEGCGRDGPIRCVFLCEFHPVAGPKILCQIPNSYITKDVFESVSVYIIPKAQLLHSVLTITVFGLKILGFPVRIDDKKYARNAYYFNLCFVFDSWARTVQYEPIIKKLTDFLVTMESENGFLSQCYIMNKKTQLIHMLTQVMNDLNKKKMCTLSEGHNTTYLKVIRISEDPRKVMNHEVPVLKESLDSVQTEHWDLTTNQILPYINGVNHVAKIAACADVDITLVKSCLQNLVYYGVIAITPVFEYCNVHVTTPKLQKLALTLPLQEECISAVARTGRQLPSFRDVFRLYCNMKYGVTVKDLCTRFDLVELHIDERNIIQHGIIKGYIRKIYKYPVITDGSITENVPYSNYYTGEYSIDEICCLTGLRIKELEELIDGYPNISYISK